jgi:anti-sigma regulatory factor (Ser/Thr protein kinase)
MHELLPATLGSVAAARRAVRRFAGDLEVDVEGLVLAASEAVANVVAHAYVDGANGVIELTGTVSPFEVTLMVRDTGQGFHAGGDAGGAGFGLLIIERLAEHVELADTPHGVELTMGFRRGGAWSAQ